MPYVAAIPQAADRIKDSQPSILGNFQAIPTLLTVNHYDFGDPNEGKHQYVSLPEQGASPATAVNEIALFSRQSAVTTQAELCIRKENSGAVTEFTSYNQTGVNGYTYLPSGILIRWGVANSTGDGTLTKADAPYFNTAIYSVQITPYTNDLTSNNKTIVLRTATLVAGVSFSLNVTGVQRLSNTATNVNFYWMVIGI